MATVPSGNGAVNVVAEEAVVLPDGTVTTVTPPVNAMPAQAVPSSAVNSEQPRSGTTLTEGVEPPKRKTTSFKITNVFQSRPPSNDPDDIWEDGDDVDDSRTEDLSDIADSLTSLSSQLDPLAQAEAGQGAPEPGLVTQPPGQVVQPPGQSAPPLGQSAPPPVQGVPPPGQVAPPPGQVAPPSVQGAPTLGQGAPTSGQQRGQVTTTGPVKNVAATQVLGPGGQVVSSIGQQVVMPQILPPVLQQQVNCPPPSVAPVQDQGRRPSHDPKLAGEARRLSATADENNQERAFQQGQAPYHLPGFGFVTFQPEGLPVTYVDSSGHLITAMVPAAGNNVDKAGVSEDQQVLPVHGPLDIRSRFKIVKIETTEPIKRGRWTCFDFLDKQTDQKIVTTSAGALPSDAKKIVSTAGPKSAVPSSLTKPSAVTSSAAKVVVTLAGQVPLVPSSVSKPAVTLSSANASVVNSATVSAVNTPDAMPSSVLTRGAGQPRSDIARSDVAEVGRFKVASTEPPQARGSTSGPGSVEREIEGANAASSRIQRTSGSRAPDPLRVSDAVYPPATYPGGQSSINGPNYKNISPQAGSPYATVNQPVIQSPVAVQGRPDFSGQQPSGHIPAGHQVIQQHQVSGHSSQASSSQQFTSQPSQQSSPQSTVSGKTGQPVSAQYIVQDKSGQQYIVQQGQQPISGQQSSSHTGQQSSSHPSQQSSSHPSQQSSSHPGNQQPTNNQQSTVHPNQQAMASGHPVQQASSHPVQQASSHPSQQASGHTGQQVLSGQQQVIHMGPSSVGHSQVAPSAGHTQVVGSAPTSGHTQVGGNVAASGRHAQGVSVASVGHKQVGGSVPVTVGHTQPQGVGSVAATVGHTQVGGNVSSNVGHTQVSGHPQQFQAQIVQQLTPQQLIQQVSHPQQVPTHSQQIPTHHTQLVQNTTSHVQQVPNQTQVSSQNQQVQTQPVSQTQQVIKQTQPVLTQPQQVSSQPPSLPPPSNTQKKHSAGSQQTSMPTTSQPTLPPSQPGVVASIAADLLTNQPGTSSTPPLHNPAVPSTPQSQKVPVGSHVAPNQVLTQQSANQRITNTQQHSQNVVYGSTPGYHYPPQYPHPYSRSVSHQPSTEVYNHHPGVEGEILAERLEEIVKEEQAVEDGLASRPEEEIESGSGAGQASIDNRIEQAMDLVKSHLMNAVRSEVEELKDKINKLEDTISHLSRENEILRARASPETLQMVTGAASQPPDPAKPPVQQH